MWTVIYLAHDGENAAKIYGTLKNDGLKVKMRPAGEKNRQGYEILVPDQEISSAHSIIFGTKS